MIKYRLDTKSALDPMFQTIHKTGKEVRKIKVAFTMAEVKNNLDQFEKVLKEKRGQMKIHAAEMKNVEENHPGLSDLDPKLIQAAYVWVEAKINHDTQLRIIEQYEHAIKDLQEECLLIQETLHFPIPFKIEKKEEVPNGADPEDDKKEPHE